MFYDDLMWKKIKGKNVNSVFKVFNVFRKKKY